MFVDSQECELHEVISKDRPKSLLLEKADHDATPSWETGLKHLTVKMNLAKPTDLVDEFL